MKTLETLTLVGLSWMCCGLVGCDNEPTTLREEAEQAQEKLEEAREEAAEIVSESEEEAVQRMADAREKAQDELEQARQEATGMVREAETDLQRKMDQLGEVELEPEPTPPGNPDTVLTEEPIVAEPENPTEAGN